jgi:methionyl-tRNA formyltransferase
VPGKEYKDYRFAIFGRISYTDHFVKELNRLGFEKPVVIVSEDDEYQRDKNLLEKYNCFGGLEELSELGLCKLYKINNINTEEVLHLLNKKKCNIGISINCRSIINKSLIDFFSGEILNIHSAHLPYERGAAGATWKILNNIDNVTSTLHYITPAIDDGDIVLTKSINVDISKSNPIDVIKKSNKVSELLITDYLEKIVTSYTFKREVQDNSKGLYFPRLYTPVNAAIDWNWDGVYIERFIRAFGEPYEGAWSYCKDSKISLIKCSLIFTKKDFHPYAYGRVVAVTDNEVKIIVKGGFLKIFEAEVGGNAIPIRNFFIEGDVFYNSLSDIKNSRTTRLKTSSMK